jgi:hypothetical protein
MPSSIRSLEFGMTYRALWLIPLAPLLVAPAAAKTPFDGTWDVAVVTRAGRCESGAHYRLTVQDGKVFGPGDISGHVTNEGYVRVSISGSYANGLLEARAGSGRWGGIGRRPLQRPMESHQGIDPASRGAIARCPQRVLRARSTPASDWPRTPPAAQR